MNIRIKKISSKDTFGSWAPSAQYSKGDEIAYIGEVYTCTKAHTSTSPFDYSLWSPNVIEYRSDMLLDLMRENIETNRLEIPFSDLFAPGIDSCIVEFSTYGTQESVLPIYLYRPTLAPLYVKKINDILFSWVNPTIDTLLPMKTSSVSDYPLYDAGGLGFGQGGFGGFIDGVSIVPSSIGGIVLDNISDVSIYKVSTLGNVLVDGAKLINVFDTFYYDSLSGMAITSDTITHLSADGNIFNSSEEA
jgi:hypothetical protein